jgi:hypothetical protein
VVRLSTTTSTTREFRMKLRQVAVPSLYLCPIQMEIMRDPVTLHTGMTYDRASIETWLAAGHNTCPVSLETLQRRDLIPNHTLRRAIRAWCVANPAAGVDPIASPLPPVKLRLLHRLLHSVACLDHPDHSSSLHRLSALAKDSLLNRQRIKAAGAVPILAATLTAAHHHCIRCVEHAVTVLSLLQPHLDIDDKTALVADPHITTALSSLCSLLTTGTPSAKVHAAVVLHTLCKTDPALIEAGFDVGATHPGAIKGLVLLLQEPHCLAPKAVHAGLRCLFSLCLPRRNRAVAVSCRAVSSLVELIPASDIQRRDVEYCYAILEILANCAEGREAITQHPLGVTTMVTSLLETSDQATENALGALWVVLSCASKRRVINQALRAGLVPKLLLVLPSDCSPRAKAKARDMLQMLHGVWGSYTTRPDFDPVGDSSIVVTRRPSQSSSGRHLFSRPSRPPLFTGES